MHRLESDQSDHHKLIIVVVCRCPPFHCSTLFNFSLDLWRTAPIGQRSTRSDEISTKSSKISSKSNLKEISDSTNPTVPNQVSFLVGNPYSSSWCWVSVYQTRSSQVECEFRGNPKRPNSWILLLSNHNTYNSIVFF